MEHCSKQQATAAPVAAGIVFNRNQIPPHADYPLHKPFPHLPLGCRRIVLLQQLLASKIGFDKVAVDKHLTTVRHLQVENHVHQFTSLLQRASIHEDTIVIGEIGCHDNRGVGLRYRNLENE